MANRRIQDDFDREIEVICRDFEGRLQALRQRFGPPPSPPTPPQLPPPPPPPLPNNSHRNNGSGDNGCVEKTSNGWRVRSTAGVPVFTMVDGRMTITVRVPGIVMLKGHGLSSGNIIKWNLRGMDKPDRLVTIQPPGNIHVDSLDYDYQDGVFQISQC